MTLWARDDEWVKERLRREFTAAAKAFQALLESSDVRVIMPTLAVRDDSTSENPTSGRAS